MAYEDMKRYFKWVDVCKINDSYAYAFARCTQKPNGYTL